MSADKFLIPKGGHTPKLIQTALIEGVAKNNKKGRHEVGKNNRVIE